MQAPLTARLLRCLPTRSALRRVVQRSSSMSSQAGTQTRLLVAHLLVKDKAKTALLDDLEQQLKAGATFAELVKQHSECGSARRQGQLGWLSRGTFYPEFEEAAFSAPVGSYTRATSALGLHLIHVMDVREEAEVQQMSVEELAALLEGSVEDVQFVDVREPWEYETAHLPHFQLFPLSKLGEWRSTISETLDPTKATLVLCHHGVRSMQAASVLVSECGFKDVKNITGGIHEYSTGVDRSVPIY